jgi:hypothetical protein
VATCDRNEGRAAAGAACCRLDRNGRVVSVHVYPYKGAQVAPKRVGGEGGVFGEFLDAQVSGMGED